MLVTTHMFMLNFQCCLTHSPCMLHSSSIDLCHHCFEKWLGARSVPRQMFFLKALLGPFFLSCFLAWEHTCFNLKFKKSLKFCLLISMRTGEALSPPSPDIMLTHCDTGIKNMGYSESFWTPPVHPPQNQKWNSPEGYYSHLRNKQPHGIKGSSRTNWKISLTGGTGINGPLRQISNCP